MCSLPPKIFKQVAYVGKVMVFVFWDAGDVIIIDYLEKGQTINGQY